ncbi:response regulator transcription factor [Erysipelotrichaceae bacterium RD49]|nr:response regulator transcription factor [Erysipelotrichaceae bacterium RD49]
MSEIWSVEDDQNIRDILIYTLKSTGFTCEGFEEASSFWSALEDHHPDLILLDIMLPQTDGMKILKKLRSDSKTRTIPVIMTTAKGMEYDKIQALEEGADDYLVKPFGMMEMVARIKAVLRRCNPDPDEKDEAKNIRTSGAVRMDLDSRKAWCQDEPLDLTRKEFDLLALLVQNPGKAFTRDELLYQVWHTDFVGETRTVDVHVRTLRTKLKESGERIETVRGIGYRFAKES